MRLAVEQQALASQSGARQRREACRQRRAVLRDRAFILIFARDQQQAGAACCCPVLFGAPAPGGLLGQDRLIVPPDRRTGRDDRVEGARVGVEEVEREQPAERMARSEEHTSELQSLMRISSAVFCLKKKKDQDSTN